jgi:hypothetical protein
MLDRPNHTEQHAVRDPVPGAMAYPRLAFEGLLACDLTLAQWPRREAWAQRFAPPARQRQKPLPAPAQAVANPIGRLYQA